MSDNRRNPETLRVRGILDALRLDDLRRNSTAGRTVRDAYGKRCACVYCGGPNQTADHVMPRALGGGHRLGNLVPACRKCNGRKGADTPADFFAKNPKAAKMFVARAIYADDELVEIARGRSPEI